MIDTDIEAKMTRLVDDAYAAGIGACLIETHRLMCARNMHDAADAILLHWDSIKRRTVATWQAHEAIQKAREQ